MKNMNCHKPLLILGVILCMGFLAVSQDSSKQELLADISYHMPANRVPYLLVNTKSKVGKRFVQVPGIPFTVYLDAAPNTIAKGVTDQNGKARLDIPASMKNAWDSSATHEFILQTEATKEFDEVTAEISITKSKISIDTVAGADARSLRVAVMQLNNDEWVPAGEVELKLGVKRLGGELPVGEEESYTTDSTGEAIIEFKREELPGDTAGNIILVARVEDNELLGNLSAEATVPWGLASKQPQALTERSLWATRDRAPVWLLITAISIMVIVWGTIIFLIIQLIKIRRLGNTAV